MKSEKEITAARQRTRKSLEQFVKKLAATRPAAPARHAVIIERAKHGQFFLTRVGAPSNDLRACNSLEETAAIIADLFMEYDAEAALQEKPSTVH